MQPLIPRTKEVLLNCVKSGHCLLHHENVHEQYMCDSWFSDAESMPMKMNCFPPRIQTPLACTSCL